MRQSTRNRTRNRPGEHHKLSILPRRGAGQYAVDHLPLPFPSGRIGYLRLAAKGAANTMTSAKTSVDTSTETSPDTSTETSPDTSAETSADTSTETSPDTSAEASGEKIRGVVEQTLDEAEPLVDKVLERTESFVEG